MNREQVRAAIRNVFGLAPAAVIRPASRPKGVLRRAARPGWPDLDDVLSRRARSRALGTVPALTALTFGDFARLEETCYATAGYVDEALFWWLAENMLACLAAGRL